MGEKIKVLVVDDSAYMRKLLTGIIDSDPACEIIKTSRDGVEGLKDVEKYKPDVVTLDIELPEIDGLACLAYIMEEFPTPVVMVTGVSEFAGDETIRALEYGAIGFVRKAMGSRELSALDDFQKGLISQIKLASQVDMRKLRPVTVKKAKKTAAKPVHTTTEKIVVIASSSGGPRALSQVIPKLPVDLPAAVMVVQHMPDEFISSLALRLNWESVLDVEVAEDLQPVQQGKILIAPGGCHCTVESNGKKEELVRLVPFTKEEESSLISANTLMISIAPIYRENAVGVVLTGMGNDGTEGLRAIKQYGGRTIAEDESTSVVYGMPKEAAKAGVVDRVVPLPEIANEITRLVKR